MTSIKEAGPDGPASFIEKLRPAAAHSPHRARLARLRAEKSSAQSPLSFVSPCRGKLRTLPCPSSPHANRLAGFARGPHRLPRTCRGKKRIKIDSRPAPGGAYKRFRHRRKPWRRANSFRPSMLIFGAPSGRQYGQVRFRRSVWWKSLGSPRKPGGSGFRGERSRSGMVETSPSAEARDMELAAARRAAVPFSGHGSRRCQLSGGGKSGIMGKNHERGKKPC